MAGSLDAQQPAAETALAVARAGRFDSALALLARARAADPDNAELQLAQARVLELGRPAPGGHCPVRQPPPAESLERGRDSGPGVRYHWEGREEAASRQVRAALASTPRTRTRWSSSARSGGRAAARWRRRPTGATTPTGTPTSGRRLARGPVPAACECSPAAGLLEASDPLRDAIRVGGEAGLGWCDGRIRSSALAGARRLDPEVAPTRTEATYRANLSWRPRQELGLGRIRAIPIR